MQTWCTLIADLCRHQADIMQTSIQVCIWRTFCSNTPSMHKVIMQSWDTLHADFGRLYADLVQTIIQHIRVFIWSNVLLSYAKYYMVISLPSFGFCRTYVASKGRLSAGCFQALRRIEKPEDQGQFGRYAPVQYLEKGTVSSQDDSFFDCAMIECLCNFAEGRCACASLAVGLH